MDSEDALSIAQVTASDRCQKGKFGEALESEQNALKIAESRYGPTHSSLVPILANLAALDRHMALYPEAESNLKWALAIEERNFGPRDPRAANPLTQLASLYFDWGHWEDAEFFQKKALSLLEKTNGGAKDRLELAEAWELLGRIDLRLHKPEEALSLLKKSSETLEKDTAIRPERLLASWDFLAQAYQASSRPAGEQSCLEKSLRLAESRFKPNSVEVADARQHLADFYRSKKRETEAKPLYDSALKIYQGCVGSYFGYSSLPYIQKLAQAEETAG
ncbi:MAG TPA: tetratricopeptide repeat protein, partial [bacterium]|nr:tetratricopeptide repeat protein [bacterium]